MPCRLAPARSGWGGVVELVALHLGVVYQWCVAAHAVVDVVWLPAPALPLVAPCSTIHDSLLTSDRTQFVPQAFPYKVGVKIAANSSD